MPSTAARYAWRAILAACLCLFAYSVYEPLVHRVINVDIEGWPLGMPQPVCPRCAKSANSLIRTGEYFRRCHGCWLEFEARPPGF